MNFRGNDQNVRYIKVIPVVNDWFVTQMTSVVGDFDVECVTNGWHLHLIVFEVIISGK